MNNYCYWAIYIVLYVTEISHCCSPTAVIATNTLRLDVSTVTSLVTHQEVCVRVVVCMCMHAVLCRSLCSCWYSCAVRHHQCSSSVQQVFDILSLCLHPVCPQLPVWVQQSHHQFGSLACMFKHSGNHSWLVWYIVHLSSSKDIELRYVIYLLWMCVCVFVCVTEDNGSAVSVPCLLYSWGGNYTC